MAPFHDPSHGFFSSRFSQRLALPRTDDMHPEHEVDILKKIALGLGSFGIICSLFAFYWLVRMRRSFRHDLIFLLIQSDLIKSLWFVIFSIVDHIRGPIASDSAFCQVSGFFLAVGIESSDIAILLITVHSALYIFRPKSGLYPYRRFAYAAYITIPLLIASLAFIGGHGYENNGHYCYLENGRGWERVALSWIPRYVIFVVVLLTYLCIYAYVRSMMFHPGKESTRRFNQNCRRDYGNGRDVPPSPGIERHGLVPSTPSSAGRVDVGPTDGRPSVSSTNTAGLDSSYPDSERESRTPTTQLDQRPEIWNWPSFALKKHRVTSRKHSDALSLVPNPLKPRPGSHTPSGTYSIDDDPSLSSTISTPRCGWRRPLSSAAAGMAGHDALNLHTILAGETAGSGAQTPTRICSMLRKGTCGPSSEDSPEVTTPGAIQDDSEIARNREKILRQFRSLFVYPLAYLLTWIFPFVSHIMGFDDSLNASDPFWLLVVSMVSLGIQGAVDCAVFTIREEPWKHTQGGFWESLDRQLRKSWRTGWKTAHVVGRTREEMLIDGRNARARREEEMAAERVVMKNQDTATKGRGGRDWWDADLDGPEDGGDGDGDGDGEGDERTR